MTRRTILARAAALGAITLVAACSGNPAPAPPSNTSSPASSAANGLPHSGAPNVEHPLPRSVVSGDPCQTALTPQQVARIITISPTGKPNSLPGVGRVCDWGNVDTGSGISVAYATEDHQGLSAVYQNSKPQSSRFEQLPPIQGFPAAAFAVGGETDGCEASVGIANDTSVEVSITLGSSKKGNTDPCKVAAQAADLVIANLRQRAGS